jgi:flavin reductase (DIM6/NTAB) family NADH-FMN oxidoreductase RutF
MASWPSGVTVVMTEARGKVYGLTVSSFSSLSVDPLLVLVCVTSTNPLIEMVRSSRHAAITMLSEEQEAVSRFFAQPGRLPVDGYSDFTTERWATGAPILAGGVAALDCEVYDMVPGGDHMILMGRVVEARYDGEKKPLIYFRRGYRKLMVD